MRAVSTDRTASPKHRLSSPVQPILRVAGQTTCVILVTAAADTRSIHCKSSRKPQC
jgi:hypothetical protein